MGSVHKSLPKGIRYEDYQPSSSEDTDTKSDVQKLIPKATENFYTNRLFGEPLTNYYSVEPILDESKLDKRELESNVRDDLVLIAKVNQCKFKSNIAYCDNRVIMTIASFRSIEQRPDNKM